MCGILHAETKLQKPNQSKKEKEKLIRKIDEMCGFNISHSKFIHSFT